MKSVISSTERSLENPAAARCPPPPDFRAITLTSTSSTEVRSDTFRAGPPSRGGSRMSAETSAPADEDTTIQADSVEELLDQYHALVIDDPASAYGQAGPTLQNAISLEGFQQYWGRFDDVAIGDIQIEEGGETALAVMEFQYPDGTSQVERHRFTFIEQDGRLVLDSDRFVETIRGRS